MVNKEVHDEYIRIYNELIDTINHKEDMIEAMTMYIAKKAKKTPSICKVNKGFKCNYRKCKECVRNYFEARYKNETKYDRQKILEEMDKQIDEIKHSKDYKKEIERLQRRIDYLHSLEDCDEEFEL